VIRVSVGLTLAVFALAPLPGCAQDVLAREAYQTGDYPAAVRAYRALARSHPADPRGARGWARSLVATGRYNEALDALANAEGHGTRTVELGALRGSILRTLGRTAEAETSLRGAIEGSATDATLARLELGELLWRRGDRDEATAIFEGFIDFYNAALDPSSAELAAVGTALTYLGDRDSQLFHDAVRAFDRAISADDGDPDPKVALAELFLSKYDSRTAGGLLGEALARNPGHAAALLARARRARFDGSPEAIDLTEQSLETNPNDPVARAFLADLYLDLEDIGRADSEARRALGTNPSSLEAWTELAAAAHMRADTAAFEDARDRVLALDPTYSQLYETLARVADRTHRYRDAVTFAKEAVALDPTSWSAYAALGLDQLRVGDLPGARETLERAFAGDPFNVWVKNTLDLLDDLEQFDTTESAHFVFRMHPDEAEILSVYAPALAEEAFDAMWARYGYAPPTPIAVEIYDRHADFSVRTVGLAGIGALGVSFGSVLAMDSPGARPPGEFNWGSTLWHEISHAFTLGMTNHRVPRWLSEGLAVLDERHARPGWGSDVSPTFLVAFKEGRLPSLERFNSGFVRPAYPGQVQHSYFLASLLCEMIEEEDGFGAILSMLTGYRDGLDTQEVFESVFGADLASFDARLGEYVQARFGPAIAALAPRKGQPEGGAFAALMTRAAQQEAAGETEEAIAALEQARAMFPDYAAPDSPTLLLARLYRAKGEDEAALEAMRAYTDIAESDIDAHVELADLEETLGHPAESRRALARAIWIDPFRAELHTRLAASSEGAGDWKTGARERRAVLALDPTDRAEAYYRLAFALHRGGRGPEARSAVLRALEIAPNYEDAIDLLIQIRGSGR